MGLIQNATNEVCTCKHTRFSHKHGYQECVRRGCPCVRFTWDSRNKHNQSMLAQAAKRKALEENKS